MKLGKSALGLIILGLALRLVLVFHATWYPISDTRDYHRFAYSLAHTNSYSQRYEGETDEYQDLTLYAYRMPGYPAFLAAIYTVFEWKPIYAYLGNVVCETITALLLFLLGRKLLGQEPALIGLGLFSLHVLWTPNLMTESLFTMLFIALVSMIADRKYFRSWPYALGMGLTLAAATFVRPIALTLLPILLVGAIRRSRNPVRLSAILLAPLLLFLGAWALRNYLIFDELVLLSTNLGPHNAPAFAVDRRGIVLHLRELGYNMAQINRILLAYIAHAVINSPLDALRLYLERFMGLFSLGNPPGAVQSILWEQTFTGPNGTPFISDLFRSLYWHYYATYPLALLGGILLTVRREWPRILWTVPLTFALLHAFVSDGHIRFAAPLYPLFSLLAGYVLWEAVGYVRNQLSGRQRSRRPAS